MELLGSNEPATHHAFQQRKKRSDLLLGVDDLDDNRQVAREQPVKSMDRTRHAITEQAAKHGSTRKADPPGLSHNRLGKRRVLIGVIIADEGAQQRRLTGGRASLTPLT